MFVCCLDELFTMLKLFIYLLLDILLELKDLFLSFCAFLLFVQVLLHSLHRIVEEVSSGDFLAVSIVSIQICGADSMALSGA